MFKIANQINVRPIANVPVLLIRKFLFSYREPLKLQFVGGESIHKKKQYQNLLLMLTTVLLSPDWEWQRKN
jgi:hypothetical protein